MRQPRFRKRLEKEHVAEQILTEQIISSSSPPFLYVESAFVRRVLVFGHVFTHTRAGLRIGTNSRRQYADFLRESKRERGRERERELFAVSPPSAAPAEADNPRRGRLRNCVTCEFLSRASARPNQYLKTRGDTRKTDETAV